jgi:hypothetical protein
MVNTKLISGAVTYRNVNECGKTWNKPASHRFFARIGRLTIPTSRTTGATEVVLAAAIHSLLLINGSFCRWALTDGA